MKKGQTKGPIPLLSSRDLAALDALTANGVKWYFRVVDNPSGSGVSITKNGGVFIADGDCGTFTIQFELVVECEDSGLFGFGRNKITNRGTFTLTRTPIEVPITIGCGAQPPKDTDCFKYKVTYSGDCGSKDPNDILGPSGVGTENWTRSGGPYGYTIRFENDAEEATAPAATVLITQTLDDDLDFSSFTLGQFGFGDTVINAAMGLSSFAHRLDLTASLGIFLDISAGIDVSTGDITFRFTSIDPETGEVPFNPLIGFLPPNEDGSEGQGFVTYSIQAKDDAPTGTVIDAVADIIFDQNEAIETPPIFNTLDGGSPTSAVNSFGGDSYPGVSVTWGGEDDENGSGISTYDVFVSEDGGDFRRWLTRTSSTEASFYQAKPGSTYSFYSVATDLVGHREAAPMTADAQTTILEPSRVERVIPAASGRSLQIVFTQSMDLAAQIADGSIADLVQLRDASGSTVTLQNAAFAYDEPTKTLSLSWDNALPEGRYTLRLDSSQLLNSEGGQLARGWSGGVFRVQTNQAAQSLQVDGSELQVAGHSTPVLFDWNADGVVDLLVGETNASDETRVMAFVNQSTNNAPSYSQVGYLPATDGELVVADSVAAPRVVDWNHDGEFDLLFGLADGRMQLWTNVNTNDAPIFGFPRYLQVGQPNAKQDIDVGDDAVPVIVDWNGDGRVDLLVGSAEGQVHVFLDQSTQGAASFHDSSLVQFGDAALGLPGGARVGTSDLNGDGLVDLIVSNSGGRLLFYPNVGHSNAPRFEAAWTMQADGAFIALPSGGERGFALEDYDDDGDIDLLTGADTGQVMIYSGAPTQLPLASSSLADDGATDSFNHTFTIDSSAVSSWHNSSNPTDVNGDGDVSAVDVLQIVNYLIENGSETLPTSRPQDAPFLDANNDGSISPVDAIVIINQLNASIGEGEMAPADASPSFSPPVIQWNSVLVQQSVDLAVQRQVQQEDETLLHLPIAVSTADLPTTRQPTVNMDSLIDDEWDDLLDSIADDHRPREQQQAILDEVWAKI